HVLSFFTYDVIYIRYHSHLSQLLGLAVLGLSIFFYIDTLKYIDSGASSWPIYSTLFLVIIATGLVLTIVGFFGCCGAIRKSTCMLVLYFILSIIVCAACGASIFLAQQNTYPVKGLIENDLTSIIQKSYVRNNDSSVANILVDRIQSNFQCCGSSNYSDWQNSLQNNPSGRPDLGVMGQANSFVSPSFQSGSVRNPSSAEHQLSSRREHLTSIETDAEQQQQRSKQGRGRGESVLEDIPASSDTRPLRIVQIKPSSSDSDSTSSDGHHNSGSSGTAVTRGRGCYWPTETLNIKMESLEYGDVYREDRGSLNAGRLKMVPQNLIFKNSKTGKVEHINKSDIQSIEWQRLALNYGVRIMMKSGNFYRIGGFKESERGNIAKFIQDNYDLELTDKELSIKGWNWGNCKFEGNAFSFDNENGKSAFEIPLNSVSHCTGSKNEAALAFHQNDDAAVGLMEARFHLPSSTADVDDPVASFVQRVLKRASVIQVTGDSIATFTELQCLTPRGRYDIKIFPSFIQLHGKTFDYKIPINSVLRLFELQHKDGRQVFFILSLDPPIVQGQTRYHFLQLLFYKDDEVTIELDMPEKEIQEKYEGKLQKTMSGPTIEIFASIIRASVNRKITVPDYKNSTNSAISCSYKNNNGLLYPLERGFIYVHKPAIHIRFDEITTVNFARSGGSTRSFDFEVETKSNAIHTFSSIEKEEYTKLYDYVSGKKLRMKNKGPQQLQQLDIDELIDSDDEGAGDAYLQRVRDEGRARDEGGESDEDEEDEDYDPDAAAGSSGEESPSEESGSDISDASGGASDSDVSSAKKKKSKQTKAPKKAKQTQPAKSSKKEGTSKPKSSPKKGGGEFKSSEFVVDSSDDDGDDTLCASANTIKAMSDLMQIFTGNPMTTLVGRKIEQATDPSLTADDWALNLEICDIINETEDGARDAARAFRRRLQTEASRNFTVTHRTLTVLETCVNNCHRRFHSLVLTKEFISDIVKIIGPKNHPPTDLQDRVLTLIERWAVAFENQPDLNGVVQVYQELKSKGITFPPQNLDTLAPIQTPRRSVPERQASPRTGQLSSPEGSSPGRGTGSSTDSNIMQQQQQQSVLSYHDDGGAISTTLTGNSYDKIMSDLNVVQSSVNVFNEILGQIESQTNDDDWALLKELDTTCRQMKQRIVELIERVTNEDVTSELLRLNDELNNVFVRHERALKRRSAQVASSSTPATSTSVQSSKVSAATETGPKELSLIDLNTDEASETDDVKSDAANSKDSAAESITSPVAGSQGPNDPDFDIFAQSRSSVYSDRSRPTNYDPVESTSESLSKLALNKNSKPLPDEISSVREQDFEEVEKWLAMDSATSGGSDPIAVPDSDFENFLASRAMVGAGDTPATITNRTSEQSKSKEPKSDVGQS
ncbi:FACT complex subunit SSRP1, partial [Fragariocoptes setiger]